MIDTGTDKPLRVLSGGETGPYLKLPYEQLGRVRALLDERAISYWVESLIVSVDDKPYVAFIYFGRKGNASQVQAVLDEQGS